MNKKHVVKPAAKPSPAPVAKPAPKPVVKRAKAPQAPPAPAPKTEPPPAPSVFATEDFIHVIESINGAKQHLDTILAQNPLTHGLVCAAQAHLDKAVATLAK